MKKIIILFCLVLLFNGIECAAQSSQNILDQICKYFGEKGYVVEREYLRGLNKPSMDVNLNLDKTLTFCPESVIYILYVKPLLDGNEVTIFCPYDFKRGIDPTFIRTNAIYPVERETSVSIFESLGDTPEGTPNLVWFSASYYFENMTQFKQLFPIYLYRVDEARKDVCQTINNLFGPMYPIDTNNIWF